MNTVQFHIIGYLFLSLIYPARIAKSYRTFPTESESETFCLYKQHFILSPNLTCCNNTVVKPGINILDPWDACTSESQVASSNAHQAAWKVYACIIQSSNGDKSRIDLNQFATLMSDQYPKLIRSQILEEVASVGTLNADVSEMVKLDKIRRTYFDIERQVCSSSESSNTTTTTKADYGKDGSCTASDEDLHRGGRCCGKNNLPFELGLNSLLEGKLKTESCLEQLQTNIFPTTLHNFSWALENSIAEICDLSCELVERNILEPEQLQLEDGESLFEIDFEPVALAMMPSWLPATVQEAAVAFAMEQFDLNRTFERMITFEFPDVEETPVIDRYGEDRVNLRYVTTMRFPSTAVHIPVICSAHKELQAFLEHFLYTKSCGDA